MAAWLKQCGIRTVAMQSTGVYCVAVYDILEQAGFEVYLVNARDTKNLLRKPETRCWDWEPAMGSLDTSKSALFGTPSTP